MGFFDDLKNKATQMQASLAQEMSRFRNQALMEAILAGCALVAAADGSISRAEKEKMLGFTRNSEALKHYDQNAIVDTFQKFVGKLEFDFAIGRIEALRVISGIKKPEEARLLVRVCCAIGSADGQFGTDERQVVREICQELGLNPGEFDL
ncbi:MAG: tellurite resistance TerB family protein [Magnetococcales bacterium]|nr:tellurite resistance TerB family protein [Magnetococcales bacterium]